MKAAYLTQAGRMEMRDTESPVIKNDDDVIVKISNVGICGSDLHYFQHGKLGDNVVREPHILGHEASGIVMDKGKGVTEFNEGDRVVIEPGLPCFTCDYCRRGLYNLCSSMAFISVPGYQGAFREELSYNKNGLFRLPASVTQEEAALIEPLAVGYNAVVTAGIQPGASVCITGAGPIGLTVLEAAWIMGAARIMVTDADDHRLSIAKAHGADCTVNILKDSAVEEGMALTNGKGFDYVLDATGIPSAMESCVQLAAKGGEIIFIGLGENPMQLSGYRMVKKQLTIKAVNRYANHFQPVINLLSAGKYNLNDFVSHRYDFSDIKEAFSFAVNPEEKKMKVMVDFTDTFK